MGLSAVVSSSASSVSSTSVTSLLSPVGIGIGGGFVALALVLLLAYYDILDAHDATVPAQYAYSSAAYDHTELKRTLVASILPLLLAFGGVVTFKALQIV